jgi:branched-chain amino acid transport system ATP-binding protein
VTAIVEAEDLHASYGDVPVLHGVGLAVAPGETVCLMGRNGMGKTTTLRAILGLTPPRRGRVRVRGVDMTGAPPHRIARAGIGYVPEGRRVFARLSVREHLAMAARPGRDGGARWTAERVLALFPRLAARLDRGAAVLSGGEQQMLAIGRALVTNPDLLILDEATEGLAPLIRDEIWRVLRGLRDEGLAAVIVDKNVEDLLGFADSAVILSKGHAVFRGTVAELRARPDLIDRHIGL